MESVKQDIHAVLNEKVSRGEMQNYGSYVDTKFNQINHDTDVKVEKLKIEAIFNHNEVNDDLQNTKFIAEEHFLKNESQI